MKPVSLIALVGFIILGACSSKLKQTELLELSKPGWLKSRPVSTEYFYGIGISPRVGGESYYSEKAKEKALSDLAGQISTQIKSEQTMYRMEDNKGVYEYLQSRVKATSEEFLEAYERVGDWEDQSNYYAFYRLSKAEFYALKAKRKNEALGLSQLKLDEAGKALGQYNFILAIEQAAAAMDAISAYLNEETSVVTESGRVDLFEESKKVICQLIARMELRFDREAAGTAARVMVTLNTVPAASVPVRFNYSGGFLVKDKFRSDIKGHITMPDLQRTDSRETLQAMIDLQTLGRTVTRNLMVRQLIEKQKAAAVEMTVEPVE